MKSFTSVSIAILGEIISLSFSSKVDQIQEIVTGNPAVIRMVVHFNR